MSQTVYSRNQIDQWQEQLTELAQEPRTTFTKKQAVEALIDPIEEALQIHSYQTVAASLKEWGLDISAGSLKQYVIRYRREHQGNTTRKRKGKLTPTVQGNQGGMPREFSRKATQPSTGSIAGQKSVIEAAAKETAASRKRPLPVSKSESELESEFNL